MEDIEIFLVIIVIFTAAAFVISFMRLWFVTHYDANLANKVKGLGLSFDKLRKEVRAQSEQSSSNPGPHTNIKAEDMANELSGINLDNMSLEEAAESIGIDPEMLNNPLMRPMAEKIFQGIKDKAKGGGDDADGVGTEAGY